MTRDWYFDLISPFAWLALPDIETLPTPPTYRPILFAGLLKHWGQLGPAEIPPKRLQTYRICVFEAARRNIPLRFPPVHPFNPLRALRLVTALGASPAIVRTAMELIWAEGCDVSTPAGWQQLTARLGVSAADELIDRTGAKEGLRHATAAAAERGVFGVPTLALGDDLFWGADAMPLAQAVIADPTLLIRGEMARVATLDQAQRNRSPPG